MLVHAPTKNSMVPEQIPFYHSMAYGIIKLITQTPHSFHLNPNKLPPKPKNLSSVPSPITRGIGDKSYVGSGARPQGTLGLAPG
jgi:hypothetical protein